MEDMWYDEEVEVQINKNTHREKPKLYSSHIFWKEVKRLANEWNSDSEGMDLIEYIDHYAPDNICDEDTFEVIYPDNVTQQQVESQLLIELQKD